MILQEKEKNSTINWEEELQWIERQYTEINAIKTNADNIHEMCEEDNDDSNDTIAEIQQFIDDSYTKMLLEVNEQKEREICRLKRELIDAYEVQHQVLMDSYGLPLQFEEGSDEKNYDECHTRLCYELYLDAFKNNLEDTKKENGLSSLLCLGIHGLKRKNIKPFFYSTKHLFKRKSSKIRNKRILNDFTVSKTTSIV